MKKTSFFLLILFLVSSFSFCQKKEVKKSLPPNKTVLKAKKITTPSYTRYVPTNYVVLDSARGDLNLDGIEDILIVLKKPKENETSNVIDSPEKRPLLLFIGQKNNEFKLVARNDATVLCFDCGGIMGDPYQGITIKNGYFSVEHYGGSAWRWTRVITYKYSKPENNWFLYKDGSESFHVSNPDNVEERIKTSKNFGKVSFENFSVYDKN